MVYEYLCYSRLWKPPLIHVEGLQRGLLLRSGEPYDQTTSHQTWHQKQLEEDWRQQRVLYSPKKIFNNPSNNGGSFFLCFHLLNTWSHMPCTPGSRVVQLVVHQPVGPSGARKNRLKNRWNPTLPSSKSTTNGFPCRSKTNLEKKWCPQQSEDILPKDVPRLQAPEFLRILRRKMDNNKRYKQIRKHQKTPQPCAAFGNIGLWKASQGENTATFVVSKCF